MQFMLRLNLTVNYLLLVGEHFRLFLIFSRSLVVYFEALFNELPSHFFFGSHILPILHD